MPDWLMLVVILGLVAAAYRLGRPPAEEPDAFSKALDREAMRQFIAKQDKAKRKARRDRLGLRVVGGTDYPGAAP